MRLYWITKCQIYRDFESLFQLPLCLPSEVVKRYLSSQSVIRRGRLEAHVCKEVSIVFYLFSLVSPQIQLLVMINLISLLHKNFSQRKNITNAFVNTILFSVFITSFSFQKISLGTDFTLGYLFYLFHLNLGPVKSTRVKMFLFYFFNIWFIMTDKHSWRHTHKHTFTELPRSWLVTRNKQVWKIIIGICWLVFRWIQYHIVMI